MIDLLADQNCCLGAQEIFDTLRSSDRLVCDACGKVEAFEDHGLERALTRVESSSGSAIAAHDVVLHGACGDRR